MLLFLILPELFTIAFIVLQLTPAGHQGLIGRHIETNLHAARFIDGLNTFAQ